MENELEEIKQKKLEKIKEQYIIERSNINQKFPKTPLEITDLNIDNLIKKYKIIVIDCWAPWCNPCRIVAPVIEELAKELYGKVVFGKLNVDENPVISTKHQIMSIPTLLVFKNGNLIDRLVGAYPKKELKIKLDTYQ